jgi:hypothetical protein
VRAHPSNKVGSITIDDSQGAACDPLDIKVRRMTLA